MEIFKKKEYITDLNPVNSYIEQMSNLIATQCKIPVATANKLIKETIKEYGVKNPEVKFKKREENGDVVVNELPLTHYIKDSIENNEVIVPSFTAYLHPTKNKSLHAEFLNINIVKRKQDKKNAFKYKQLGDMDKYIYYNTLQKVRKIFNNSLSGAYASKSTVLNNPSAHYTLTSMTRSVASIGNAITESFVAGNKLFMTPEITANYIASVISNISKSKIEAAINKYNIHIPTTDEVMDMILYSSRLYWRDETKENVIREIVDSLEPYQKVGVMYVNDLHHLKKYNPELVKTMLFGLSRKVLTGSTNPLESITKCSDGVRNLAHLICSKEIKGKNIDYNKLIGDELLLILGSTADNINNVFNKYRLLIRSFYVTNMLPINIANMKDAVRDAIVLSDTDSTCGSYDKWVEWYYGNLKFTHEAVALAGAVMTMNNEIMDHNLKIFSKNMNIEDKLSDLLKMKNEFFWSVFVTANVSKHYFANTIIQEGNVYKESDLELKGVHLIASAGDQDVVATAHNMIKDIMHTLEEGKKLDIEKYINIVVEAETNLLKLLNEGNINIFKKEKIKDPSSYKDKNKAKTPYFYHLFWKEVFSESYGYPGEPQYMVLKIPTKFETPKMMKDYLETMEDRDIAEKFTKCISKYKKDKIGIIKVPVAIAGGRGIPKPIINMINKKKLVTDSLNVFYIVLETIGIYRKPDLMISEMNLLT